MDAPINEILKNIIHIDKSAIELREKLDKDIEERKKQTDLEIEMIKRKVFEILEVKVKEVELVESKKAESEVEKIRHEVGEKCEKMSSIYKSQRDILVKELFKEIFSL